MHSPTLHFPPILDLQLDGRSHLVCLHIFNVSRGLPPLPPTYRPINCRGHLTTHPHPGTRTTTFQKNFFPTMQAVQQGEVNIESLNLLHPPQGNEPGSSRQGFMLPLATHRQIAAHYRGKPHREKFSTD